MTPAEQIADLHARFVQASGRPDRLSFNREGWQRLAASEPYFGDIPALTCDMVFVVAYLRAAIARDKRHPGALKLRNLQQPEQFSSDLAEAIGMGPKKYAAHCRKCQESGTKNQELGTKNTPTAEASPQLREEIAKKFAALKTRYEQSHQLE